MLLNFRNMKLNILISLLFVAQLGFSQAQFQYRYGSQYFDGAKKTIQTLDGNFVVVGSTNGFGSGGNALIMKVNSLGNIMWVKNYAGINSDIIYDIIEMPDGTLMMCGSTNSFGAGSSDAFVMKTDNVGSVIWAKSYGTFALEAFYKISKDGTGGFYTSGMVQDSVNNICGVIVKMDSVGIVTWAKRVNGIDLSSNGFAKMTSIATGGVVLAGKIFPNNSFSIWRFSASGNLQWSHNFLPTPFGSGLAGLSVIENPFGEILIATSLANVNTVAQSGDFFIFKLDSGGNLISHKSYGGTYTDLIATIENTNDSCIILCGQTNSFGNGGNDACLVKIRPNGSVAFARAYGTPWDENPANSVQTFDKGYVLTGQTYSVGFLVDSIKVLLVKTDSLGNSLCNVFSYNLNITNHTVTIAGASSPQNHFFSENGMPWNFTNRSFYTYDICNPLSVYQIDDVNSIVVFPNPFTNSLTVTSNNNQPATITIYDITSRKLLQQEFINSITLSTSQLPKGIYLYQVRNKSGVINKGKVVKD